jgi:outer membrane receptor protein involved in Fe transport
MRHRIALLALLFLLPLAALAQQESRPGVTAYAAAWFAANQPASALDMVRLLPGFRLQGGDPSLRGFAGAVGNVLVDGVLPASKEESLETALQRIPAATVERIELIRAGTPGMDLHGYPLAANIVRIREASLRGRVEVEDAFSHFGMSAPRAALHLTRQGGDDTLDLSATYGREWNGNHGFGRRDRFAPDGTVLRLADYAQPELKNFAQATAGYRRGLWGGTLRLSGVIEQEVEYSNVLETVTFPAPQTTSGRERDRDRGLELELQYERALDDGGRWQVFASHRSNESDGLSLSTGASGTDTSQDQRSVRESILRGNVLLHRGALTLETGAEGAINLQDTRSTLASGGAAVLLPNANVRVEEQRGEFFLTTGWRPRPGILLEGGLRYELSRIGQSGDTNLSRPLSFLKPRLLASWKPDSDDEVRFLAERRVGQLDFDGFVSSASLTSNTVSAGNRNLLPDRSWRLELAWEHHFWDRASLTLTARRDLITGVLDHLPVTVNGQVFDTTGNAGSGRRDELEASLILPLDRLSLTGMALQFDGTARHSRISDPVTGRARRFSGSEPLEGHADLTQDLPAWKLRWGLGFSLPSQETDYRIDEIDDRHHVSRLSAFVEYRPAPAWRLRLFGQDLAQPAYVRDRRLYDGLRGSVPLDHEERRSLNNGALLGLNIQFDFGG